MTSSDFLTNMKLIFEHGRYKCDKSKLGRLIAIHEAHYTVEQILREKATDQAFQGALHDIGFEKIIKKLNETQPIPDFDRLLNLNRIRNGIEHHNITPDWEDVIVHLEIAESFLRWSCKQYFDVDYDLLLLENAILDGPIKRVMLEAKQHIKNGDLQQASNKMYEALGAFKFTFFGYYSDPRVIGQVFEKDDRKIDFPNLLSDLAFKILLAEDEKALTKVMSVSSSFIDTPEQKGVKSVYPLPQFKDKAEAENDYAEILGIILNHQNKVPVRAWRE